MISIVCVYNDAGVLDRRLLGSLAAQAGRHEVIPVDNRASRFTSAASALNWGASRAAGDWLLFAHQDVALLARDWLARAEGVLERHAPRGWCGVAGTDASGRFRGMLVDRSALDGEPFDEPEEVQTLDECLLIHRREAGAHKYFDEGLAGWHAYGVEACCAAIRGGAKNYVLPLPVWHDSASTNMAGLEEAHRYVWEKHGAALGRITTTCGDLPGEYGWGERSLADSLRGVWGRVETSYYHRVAGYPGAFHHILGEWLDAQTATEQTVECLHRRAWYGPLEARAFAARAKCPRRVVHRFAGWDVAEPESGCVVVATDLAAVLPDDLGELPALCARARRVLVCVNWEDARARPSRWKALEARALGVELTRRWDGTRAAVLELRARGGPRA